MRKGSVYKPKAAGKVRRQRVILPDNKVLAIPFEAINVNSVQVTAFRVFENNMGQFYKQTISEAKRLCVGRYLWRRPRSLRLSNEWNRYNIDVTELYARPRRTFRIQFHKSRQFGTVRR